jgi:hypothetical protein
MSSKSTPTPLVELLALLRRLGFWDLAQALKDTPEDFSLPPTALLRHWQAVAISMSPSR